MTLSIEQFNKIALKTDIEELKKELKEEMMTKVDKSEILSAINSILKTFKDHEIEHISNITAHDRMQSEINETKKHVGLEIKSKAMA